MLELAYTSSVCVCVEALWVKDIVAKQHLSEERITHGANKELCFPPRIKTERLMSSQPEAAEMKDKPSFREN